MKQFELNIERNNLGVRSFSLELQFKISSVNTAQTMRNYLLSTGEATAHISARCYIDQYLTLNNKLITHKGPEHHTSQNLGADL